jgi:AraC-like DNA-binding protein
LEPSDVNVISFDDEFIKRVHDTIEEKMPDPEFNVEVLLKDFALGQRQFTRKVIALTGQTPGQFIRIMRLKRALKLIKQKAGTVSQIAFEVGFSNLSYFSKCFRMQFGKLPSEIV